MNEQMNESIYSPTHRLWTDTINPAACTEHEDVECHPRAEEHLVNPRRQSRKGLFCPMVQVCSPVYTLVLLWGAQACGVPPTPRKQGQVGPQGGHLSCACRKDWCRAVWVKPTPGWGTALKRAQMQEGAFQEAALFGVTNVKSLGGQPES